MQNRPDSTQKFENLYVFILCFRVSLFVLTKKIRWDAPGPGLPLSLFGHMYHFFKFDYVT